MAVVVDKAIWPYKGKLWAHLASDKNLDELHSFAELLGLRLMSFQGDHYDIPEEVRDKAIELGAEEIDGRDLLSRLKKAELRLPASERPGKWEKLCFLRPTGDPPNLGGFILKKSVPEIEILVKADWGLAEVTVFKRDKEVALVIQDPSGLDVRRKFLQDVEWRCIDGKLLEILI